METPIETSRLDRLRASIAKVRVRATVPPFERILAVGGAVLMTLGIAFIVLGWVGASHTPYVFEQIPYMISGGLLGAALAVVGALFYFAFWMTKQVQTTREEASQTRATLERIEALLAGGVAANGSVATAAKPATAELVKTGKGTMFHVPDCKVVEGRSDLTQVSGDEPGLTPCRICDPLGARV
jgi:hypothetical protein